MEIVEKRGRWVLTDVNGKISKFATEQEAKEASGIECECEDCDCDPCECLNEETLELSREDFIE